MEMEFVAMHVGNFVAEPFMDKIMEFGGFVIKYWQLNSKWRNSKIQRGFNDKYMAEFLLCEKSRTWSCIGDFMTKIWCYIVGVTWPNVWLYMGL